MLQIFVKWCCNDWSCQLKKEWSQPTSRCKQCAGIEHVSVWGVWVELGCYLKERERWLLVIEKISYTVSISKQNILCFDWLWQAWGFIFKCLSVFQHNCRVEPLHMNEVVGFCHAVCVTSWVWWNTSLSAGDPVNCDLLQQQFFLQ